MSEVLFLAHRMPWPPNRGDKIRSHHVLQWIAQRTPVHVATFAEGADDLSHESDLSAIAASYRIVRRHKALGVAAAEAVVKGRAVSLTAFADTALQGYVDRIVATRPLRAIYVFSGQMAQYVPASYKGRVVMDFVDVDSAKFESYAATSGFPIKLVYAREGRRLAAFERRVAQRADASLFVSEAEAAFFRSRNPDVADRVQVITNGVDCARLDPVAVEPAVEIAGEPGPHIVFTGQMDYPPNEEAAVHFAREIMPLVRAVHSEARFHIVGRNPTARVEAVDGLHGTAVTGEVPDVRPWLKSADVVVAPLRIARGVQNKVLEAMAMGRPVVASAEAATGIEARSGEHLVVVDDGDAAMVQAVLHLLDHPKRARALGIAARRLLQDSMSWNVALKPLEAVIGGNSPLLHQHGAGHAA